MKNIVIIPTYNEKDTVEIIVRKVFEHNPDINILIVDDNSPDGTQKIVERLMNEFPNLSIMRRKGKEGLGKAYTSAFIEVLKNPEVSTVITMDADFSHDPKYIPIMLQKRDKYDFIVGSRYIRGGGTEGWELWRRLLSFFGNMYTRTITRIPLNDITAGFGTISTDKLRRIDLDSIGSSGYAFLIELKYCLYKTGAKMTEIPIIFKNRIGGESKISNHIIGEGIKAPWRLIFRKPIKDIYCLICDKKTIHKKYSNKNGHDIYKCKECGILKIHPLPKDNKDIYNKDYFSGASHGFGYVDYDKDKEAMKNVFVGYMNRIEGILNKKNNKSLLDIGAATGYFMKIAKDFDYEVYGIEVSFDASRKGIEKGLNIFNGTIEDFDNKNKKFDIITMLDVIEHVDDPRILINKSKKMLTKNGLVVINTPDSGSLYARILGKKWHLIVPPEHIHYFNRDTISKLLDKEGLEVIVSTTIGKKFTLEYVFLTLGKWLKFRFFFNIASFMNKNPKLGHLSIPINLRDNMFIIAKLK